MRVTIVGAGAVGQLIGALLARSGHRLSFVARGDSLDAIRSGGVLVTAPTETFATGPLAASADPADLGAADLVVVCVKSWQVEAIAKSIASLVDATTIVVPVQNGVEAADHLARAVGDAAVIGGVCHVLATSDGPGRVRYIGPPPSLMLGERGGGASARVEALAGELRRAGIIAPVSADIGAAIWSKLLFVEPLGSVGAVTRAPAEVIRALPETRAMLEQAMREVRAVAAGNGVVVPEDAITQSLARIDAMPAGATTSMHRDLVEGRPSELQEQTGAVVRLGRRAGVERAVHDVLFASLLPQERRARGV